MFDTTFPEWNTYDMGKKLLVADDSVTIQKVIKLALSSEGYEILAVSEGNEALRAIREELPDVVLIDVALPNADAYAVKKEINQNPALSHIAFVLMTSAFEKVDESAVEQNGFHGRLVKPFDPSHLRKTISDLISKATAGVMQAAVPTPPKRQEIASISLEEEADLPPVEDAHPTIEAPSSPNVSDEEFTFDAPIQVQQGNPNLIESSTGSIVGLSGGLSGGYSADTTSAAQTPPPVAPPPIDTDLENDIRNLTESTIKLSGLDEFEWNLDDSKKMRVETPPSSETTQVYHTATVTSLQDRTREITRPAPVITAPSKPIDDGGSNFPLQASPPAQNASPISPVSIDVGAIEIPGVSKAQSNYSMADIEQMIKKDVEQMLEKMAKETIPKMAESIIKKEIEKILAE